jgi:1-acyl-sn-glycerol-3-phosphate acyltransferase
MSTLEVGRKNKLAQAFFTWLNSVVLSIHFKEVKLSGLEHLPTDGPFLAVANHQSRWDGLVLFRALNRVANYMVSPNELRGFQGAVIKSLGGFPANLRFDLLPYMESCILNGEAVAIFPEGNVFRDGNIHPFKKGAARLVMMCYERGITLPVVPIAIHYHGESAQLTISKPLDLEETISLGEQRPAGALELITQYLQEQVTALRDRLMNATSAISIDPQRTVALSELTARRPEIA